MRSQAIQNRDPIRKVRLPPVCPWRCARAPNSARPRLETSSHSSEIGRDNGIPPRSEGAGLSTFDLTYYLSLNQARLLLRLVSHQLPDRVNVRNHILRSGKSFRTTGLKVYLTGDRSETGGATPIGDNLSSRLAGQDRLRRASFRAGRRPVRKSYFFLRRDFLAEDVLREAATLGLSIRKSSR
jgi:hypothetical protein